MAMTGKGRRDGLHPDFLTCLDRYADEAARLGYRVTMLQGRRTYEEQKYFWDGWVKRLPGFNLAAAPGTSNHEIRADGWAYAADLSPNVGDIPALNALLAPCGLYLAVRRNGRVIEPWHVEPIWRHGGRRPDFLTPPVPAPTPTPPPTEDDEMTPEDFAKIEQLVAASEQRIREEVVLRARNTNGATVVELPDGSLAVTGVDRDGPWVRLLEANPEVIGALTKVRAIEPVTVTADKLTEGEANALNGFRP